MKLKFNYLTILAALLIALTGCSSNKKVEKQVLKASENWISNFNKGNTTEIANAYTEDAIMVAKPFGTFKGRKSISEFWTPFIKSGATDLKYTNTKVEIINNKQAIVSSDWTMNVGKGIITNETWIKMNGVWKLKEDHFEVTKNFNNNEQ